MAKKKTVEVAPTPGRYRIQYVSEKTGIPSATLRAWERRYGIPRPARTEAAYRLYSDQDIELLVRMNQLCTDGLSPAEAAQSALSEAAPVEAPVKLEHDRHGGLVNLMIEAVERFDPFALESAVAYAMTVASPLEMYEHVFQPVQTKIGERWHAGTLSVAQEHLATEALGRAVRAMRLLVEPPESTRLAVLACFEEEDHAFPLYGVGFRLAGWGFRTVMLGPRTPPAAIEAAVQSLRPELVGLSVTIAPPAHRAERLVASYGEACGSTLWAVGGQAAKELARYIEKAGGIVAEQDLSSVHKKLERKKKRA